MPIPAIIPILAAGLSAGSSIAQISAGNKTARDAKQALDSYQRQDLTNYAEGLPIRTEAQQFKAQQYDQATANALNIVQQSGNFGNVTGIVNQNLAAKKEIAADIQTQRNKIDQLKLDEATRIRTLQEQREKDDLAGIGAQYQFGQQQKAQGVQGLASSFGQLAQLGIQGGFEGANPNKAPAGTPLATNSAGQTVDATKFYQPQVGTEAAATYNEYYG